MPARYDQVEDPAVADALLTARRGTAYFLRKLSELSDDEFAEPSLLPGWSRAHVIAHVGYNARALTRLIEWANTGVETPMYASTEQRMQEIEDGATLKPIALRHLVAHSNVHLNVEWRDLPADAWSNTVRTAQGRTVPVSETAWMRAREVWIHAVDLNNGASFDDMPPDFLDALLADVTRTWELRGETLDVTLRAVNRPGPITSKLTPGSEIVGTAADLASWATGRGVSKVTASTPTTPGPPRWL